MILVDDWQTLGSPKLTTEAKKYYRDRGVTDEIAQLNNLRFLRPEETAKIWGKRAASEALLFPFSRDYGAARLLERTGNDRFRSTEGLGSRLYQPKLPKSFGTTFQEIRRDADHPLIIGEGPTRALAAISRGLVACGIAGSWNWQKGRSPLLQLRKINWRRREVTPIFDADVTENNNVLLPYLLFGDWLQSQGARVIYVRIPRKVGAHAGLDDYLKKHGREKFDALRREDWDDSRDLEQLRLSAMRTTEGGLAALFTLQHGDNVRYDSTEGCWYAWNGMLWQRQADRAPDVQEAMKESIDWIMGEASKVKNEQRRKSMRRWGTSCDKKSVVGGAMNLASSDRRLRVTMNELDRDPYLLGTQTGIIDLRTGKPVAGARDQLISRSVGCELDPAAKSQRWEAFVSEVMLGDQEMIEFIQRFVGYLLIGGNPERLIFFLYGIGRNGKSVFIETLLKLLGDYGVPAKSKLIMKQRADRDSESAEPFMLSLRGHRYITASEVDEGMQLDAAVVKNLTGGDEITVRGLHKAPVRFTVEGKFVVRCNHRPIIDGADQAIWDRIVEIPFEMRLSEETQDTGLREELNRELPGILNWALEGARAYQDDGLKIPTKVRQQISAYRDAMDTVSLWMKERTAEDRAAKTSSGMMFADYERWCGMGSKAGAQVFPVSQLEFSRKLAERGYVKKKAKGVARWYGLKLVGDVL